MTADDEILRTQTDLHDLWGRLIPPGGFDTVSLWVLPIDASHRPIKQLVEIADLPMLPPRSFAPLTDMISDELDSGLEVAFLITRPGASHVSEVDAAWARGLIESARAAGLGGWPVHLATNHGMVVVPPDALSAAG